MSSTPYVLVPTLPEDADVTAPVTEDSSAAWAAGTYSIGDVRHRASTHRKYRRLTDGTDGASDYPEDNPTAWQDYAPTDRWAPFDYYVSTANEQTSDITYTIAAGFMNAVALYGLQGTSCTVTYKDAPGGTVLHTETFAIDDRPVGWYEWFFGAWTSTTKRVITDLPISPTGELTVTVTAGGSDTRAIGVIAYGDLTPLVTTEGTGTLAGARAKLVDYSYINRNDDGSLEIVRRRSARDMQIEVTVAPEEFNSAFDAIERVLAVPACWFGSLDAGYESLNVFGLGNAEMEFRGASHAVIPITVQGLI